MGLRTLHGFALFFAGTVAACTGSSGLTGSAGESTLVSVTAEPTGANCANGGQRIDTGVDTNGNGTLDSDEVTASTYVCNGTSGASGGSGGSGADGSAALISVTAETAGANCASGGQRIDVGIDDNHNGTLDAGEIDSTMYVCNGADGANGTNGTNGSNGSNGSNGTDGTSSLIKITAEPAGPNCGGGGQRIDVGIDDNHDGTLDSGEIDQTAYVCNAYTPPSGPQHAYLANWAGFNTQFDVYDFATDTWSSGAALPVTSVGQITSNGSLVVMLGTNNTVYDYDVTADAWTADGAGPSIGSYAFLEWLDGNLYACSANSATLHVRQANVWSTIALSAPCSAAGGVDATAHEVYVKTFGQAGFSVIDSLTNTVSRTIIDATSIAENTSSAAALSGELYTRSINGDILALDTTTGSRVDTGADPTGLFDAMVTEPDRQVVYIKSSTGFSTYSPSLGTFTALSAGPANQATVGTITLTY